MIEVKIKCFGAFRNLGSEITLNLASESNVGALRTLLSQFLKSQNPHGMEAGLVADSVFADETQILSDESRISENVTLNILPPVCGG